MRNAFVLIFAITFWCCSFVQGQTDSILLEKDFLEIVKTYHPIAIQAELIRESGDATLRTARGGFDPKLFLDHATKELKDKKYYDLTRVGLKIPTWFGLEAKAGWDYAYGSFVNPEDNTSLDGIGYVGLSFSPNGLFIDKRKATLLKAKQYQQMSVFERNNVLNDLYRDAILQYWKWATAYSKYNILKSTLTNAELRMSNVRSYFENGELSVLDTLESFTQIQALKVDLSNAKVDFLTETYFTNVFIWGVNMTPLEIDNLIPESLNEKVYSQNFNENFQQADSLINIHPLISVYTTKLEVARINQRLYKSMLLPKMSFNYNALSDGNQFNQFNTNDFKWGVNLSLPIFLRKERGMFRMAEIKIQEQESKLGLKVQELLAKTNTYKASISALQDQNKVYSDAVEGYRRLLRQEEFILLEGESSLFKVTLREIKLFQSELKQLDLKYKLIKSKVSFIHSFGSLYNIN